MSQANKPAALHMQGEADPSPCSPAASAWQPAWLGLGANLGDTAQALAGAVAALAALPSVRLAAASRLYHSAPVDAQGPQYLNAAIAIHTTMQPLALLHAMQAIETAAGRQRPYRNAPRTLDLDLLAFGQPLQQLNLAELTLPHPRMYERAFVLRPLAEIAPALVGGQQLARVQAQQARPLPAARQWPLCRADDWSRAPVP